MEQKIIALLLDGLHQDANRASADRLASLTREEWQSLLVLAGAQRVRGLLYHRLRSRGWESIIPHETALELNKFYRHNAVRNLALYGELNRIVTALQASDIPVVVLKGAFLASVVYANLALREMNDIDLLVPASRLEQAAAILEARGYEPLQPYMIDLTLITVYHLPRFIKPQTAAVELHWNITLPDSGYRIDAGELWDRAVPTRIADVEVLGLCAEDLLLHLCLHTSYQHQFEFGLRPSCDIAQTIHRYGDALDWSQFVERARQWRWQRGVYLALRLAQELVGATVPDEVLHALRPVAFDETMIVTTRMQIFTDRKLADTIPFKVAKLWQRTGLAAKVGELVKSVCLPRTTIASMYAVSPNSPGVYLCYPIRLKDVLVKYWRTTLNLHRGDPMLTAVAQRKAALQKWLAEE